MTDFGTILSQRNWRLLIIATVFLFLLIWFTSPTHEHTYVLPVLPAFTNTNQTSETEQPDLPIPFHSSSRLLPFRYWNHRSLYPERYTDDSCMKLPELSDIQYAASSWQLLQVENGSVYIYGAYYDARFEEPYVRVLVYTDVVPVPKLFCQLWFPNDNEPQTELAEALYGWEPAWGGPKLGVNEPYVLTCACRRHLPEKDIAPIAVAVVTEPCGTATNVLDVQNAPFDDPLSFTHKEPRRDVTSVAVCVKWLHFRDDVSIRIIEWMQLLKHFGADKVYIYIVKLHPNSRKVLKYYEDEGFAEVTDLSHPPQVSGLHQTIGERDFRDMRRELLPLNDCLYRNIGQHDWLAAIDLDEIIVPAPAENWADLIVKETEVAAEEENGLPFDALVFPNYFVLDGAQRDLVGSAKTPMLSHTWRSKNPSPPGECVKSFFNVSSVTAMHNHYPMHCKNSCRSRDMEKGPGKMLHYRAKCQYNMADCVELHEVVREDLLDKYRKPVLKDINELVDKFGLEPL